MKLHQLVNHSKHGDRNQSLAWHQSLDTSHQIPVTSHQSSGKYMILVIQVISFPSAMGKHLRDSVSKWHGIVHMESFTKVNNLSMQYNMYKDQKLKRSGMYS